MCKTIGRFVNTSTQTVAANGMITFNNNTISNNNLVYTTSGIQIRKPGTYMINANFTNIPTAVGLEQVSMQENGVSVAGASAANTVATIGNYNNLAFNAIVTVQPGPANNYATISFVNNIATTFSNANVIITEVE
jgi:hypothetical protein